MLFVFSLQVLGQNLHEAQTLNKKHIKLKAEIQGHQPQINKCLAKGKKLCDEHHPEKGLVSPMMALGGLVQISRVADDANLMKLG